jgi:acylphosphatase
VGSPDRSEPSAVLARAHLIVRGRVQGVFFRASAAREASARGLAGWVRNLADGTVEAVLQGPRPLVEEVIGWAHQGPPAARVDEVLINWQKVVDDEHPFESPS